MNGYAIARLAPGEAEAVFELPRVRHVALMDDGTTFVAFDGDIPVQSGAILQYEEPTEASIPWARPQVRRTIENDAPEYIALYAPDEAERLTLFDDDQVSLVAPDMVLVLSSEPLLDRAHSVPAWTACSERILDKRLQLVS